MLGYVHRLEPSAKEQTGPALHPEAHSQGWLQGPVTWAGAKELPGHPEAHSQGWLQGPVTRAGAQELPGKDPALGIRCSLVAVLRLSIILSLNLYFVSEV